MKKRLVVLTAAITAAMLTACGNGEGVVINGTTAEGVESTVEGDSSEVLQGADQGESKGGTKIEIITGESQPAESGAESMEGQTEPLETAAPTTAAPTTAAPTTAAPTMAASTKAASTTAAPTTAAQQYKVTDVKKDMYATSSVRVRSSYSTSSEVLGALAEGEKVAITGESSNGWMRVNYKGQEAYVSKSYLTDTQPTTDSSNQASQPSNSTTKPSSTTNTGTTPGGASSPAGPTTENTPNGPSSPGGTTSPGTTSPSGPGGTSSPSSTPSSGTSSSGTPSTGNKSTVTGTITSIDPSGITLQTSDGTSYQFVWGEDTPPTLSNGEKAQIQYILDSSGQRRVTQVSK